MSSYNSGRYFFIEDADSDGDFKCPDCNDGFDVDWFFTEYGDPMDGGYVINCPHCNEKILLDVATTTTYTASKPKGDETIY